MDSKWASGKSGAEILFTDRESVETYLDRLGGTACASASQDLSLIDCLCS